MELYPVVSSIVMCVGALIWKRSDPFNTSIKLALFGLGLWGISTWI